MTRRLLVQVLLTSLLAASVDSACAQPNSAQREDRLRAWLKKYPDADADKDGILTPEEARKYRDDVLSKRQSRRNQIQPTHANVKYGPHKRNVFDLWLPKSAAAENAAAALPVYVHFHGGGFVAGDKSGFDPSAFLEADIAVVSGNYRFVDGSTTLCPTPLRDAARAIQYLRSRAAEWKLDEHRIAVGGSSAGAVISMWIGYHDDLADPDSDDPVARQSSRVKCIIPHNGPSNLDPRWITKNMGGPKHIHSSFPKMFGAPATGSDRPEVRARILKSSPIEHVSKDDPPSLLIYSGRLQGIPLPESASTGVLVHHAYFGKVLKERLDDVGVPNQFVHGGDPPENLKAVILCWLQEHLLDQ